MKTVWIVAAFQTMAMLCSAQEIVDYARQIKPILQSRCYACHGALKQEAGLRVDTAELMRKGGEHGVTIVAGNAPSSLLLKRISAADESERMPPEGEPLKTQEVEAIKTWIAQGAAAPADEQPERDPRDHWAFRVPVRTPTPRISNPDWSSNPIDVWISQEHQNRGLTPQRPADKRIWLRRVSLDLIGLPPSLAEQETFVSDESVEAYGKVVTRLLESPQYGERWGRHWMDIWRYSDWWGLGAEVRNSQKHIWHWRDWIIESLNGDKGYDQMLREMLAADELYPNDMDKLRAGGFLARQYFKFNRTSWLDETIEHTSKAMLGLTLNCAKCHDHKYDPFSQTDYYRLRAIFEPYQVRTDLLADEIDAEKNGLPRPFDCNLDSVTFVHLRGDDRNPDKSRCMEPGVPKLLAPPNWTIAPVPLPSEAIQPGLRPFVLEAHLKNANARITEATAALRSAEVNLTKAIEAERLAAMIRESQAPVDALLAIPRVIARDDFTLEQPDRWEQRDGKWSYSSGRLVQSRSGATRAACRLRQSVPTDFEAKLTYIPTGGDQWKSVGITFDVTDRGNEVLAYLSSFAGGPKSQIAYKVSGNYQYPADAMQARTVDLNKPHEIVLRIRGTLVNVAIDGTHSIAYRLPISRQPGHLEVITFDATAEFLGFEVRELLPTTTLVESALLPPESVVSIDRARLEEHVARKTLVVAELQPESIQARYAADRARFETPPRQNLPQLIAAAVRAERMAQAAKADEAVSRAELELLKSPIDKQPDASKKVNEAKSAWEAAQKAIDVPGESYASLIGAVKTAESNLETEDSRRKPFPTTSTGRRSALAHWIASERNPLTARVAVNHIWSRHFGKPLVPTVFDFGRKGAAPTHPELLDGLAVELMEHGWSMKHIHRMIVLSNTYRMTSSSLNAMPETITAAPDNKYYWRGHPIRMEAQIIRDSLLHLAGELDLTCGGPSIPVTDESSKRRSLYFVHSHNEHQKFLSMFDDAGVLECYRRAESIVPQQALALENSPLASAMAEKIAARIAKSSPNLEDRAFIRIAFLTILCVEPTESEMATVLESFEKWNVTARKKNVPNTTQMTRTSLIQALLNHNDFVTIR